MTSRSRGISDAWQFLSGGPWMIGGDYEVLHNSSRCLHAVRLKPLNTKVIQYAVIKVDDVWDNLSQTARKLLILKTERCPSG